MSRIRSLELDDIKNSELLTARMMSNDTFNDTFEAGLNMYPSDKLDPSADMEQRRQYIKQKYIERKYVAQSEASKEGQEEELLIMLQNAVINRHVPTLLQAFGERVSFDVTVCLGIFCVYYVLTGGFLFPSPQCPERQLHTALRR